MPRLPLRGLVHELPRAADSRPDAELLDRFHRDGDAAAFEAIVRRHGPRVLSAARYVLGHSPDADDVFQAAFLTLAREAARIRHRPALGGWLYSVAHRLALLARTDAARRARIESRRPAPAAVEPPDLAVREAGDILHEELNRLPEALRLPLLLCYLDGMTRDEAARELGVGVDVLRGRLERGRDRLRARLVRRGISLPTGLLVAAASPAAAAPTESLVRTAVAGATTGTAPAAVRTLTRLGTASMILAKVKLAAVVVAVVGLVSVAVVLGATGAPDGPGGGIRADGPEPDARAADPVTPRQPGGDEPPVIVGRVVDEAGGGVAGAQVRVAGSGKDTPTAATDHGGAFRMVLPPGQEYSRPFRRVVIATDQDGRQQGVAYFNVVRDARNLRVTLRPARAATVRVRDVSKQPVADARVVLVSAELTQLATGTTAGDGAAVVRYPAGVEVGFVFALKGGVGFDYFTTLKERRGSDRLPLPADIALVLSGARTVRVKAVDGAGRPVAGLTVFPWYIELTDRAGDANIGGCAAVQAVTDAAGVATFDWIPADRSPGISFLSHSREYSYFEPFLLKSGSPAAGGTLRMIRMARLSGRVLGSDGMPAAGIVVEASGVGSAFHHGRGVTTTRADGSYEMTVNGEEAYAVAVVDDRRAAATRTCVAREGATVGGLDFRLGEGTVLRGRMTVGDGKRPVAGEFLSLQEKSGVFPEELRKAGDRFHHELGFYRSATTDADGNYRFRVGPGTYTLVHSATVKSVKITVDREKEVVTDIHLPRPDRGRLTGVVVDAGGRSVAGAAVHSRYMRQTNWSPFEATTTAGGTFAVERVLVPAAVYAQSADKSLAGLSRITADQEHVTVRVGPLAAARGRLLDHDGKAVPGGRVQYGVRIPANEGPNAPFHDAYGGVAVADGDGWYTCTGLLVGEEYHLSYEQTPETGPWTGLTKLIPAKAETIPVGDTKLPRPYRPPTLEETTAKLFARRGNLPDRVAAAQTEARRLHMRVLLVVGDPREAATRTLVDLTEKQRDVAAAALADFEQVAVSAEDAAGLAAFREAYARDRGLSRWPALVILGDDGKVLAAECPVLDDSKAAAAGLRAFLSAHAPPRPDAETLLAAARTRARAEGKRVFLRESAAWCGPCRRLSRFLDQHRATLEPHFVFVEIDRGRYARGGEVMERYRGKEGSGIPWCAVLDADGKMLANWDGPGGNIGFPTGRTGVDHFLRVLADTAPRLTDGQRGELQRTLEQSP